MAEPHEEPPPPPSARSLSPLELKRERSRLLGNPAQYAEIQRIVGLPVVPQFDDQRVEEFCLEHVLARAFDDGFRLWPVQCEGIDAFDRFDGLFAPIGVGWGKTMITQAIADVAYRKGLKKIMLLVPSQVLVQLVKADFPFARRRIPIGYPVHVLGGKPPQGRRMLARSGKRGLYIMTYALLSRPDASDTLDAIRPELIIADEADNLGNRSSARTKRIMSYVRDHKPLGACLSGTITSKTIKDYYHLIKWCLGRNCPLPLSSNLASEWASRIDAQASSSDATGPIAPLVEWATTVMGEEITKDRAGFRKAYRLRLKTAPGVVATGDAEIKPSLILHNEPVKDFTQAEGWEDLDNLRRQVVESFLTPNGDEIEHQIHTYKWLYELSSGLYNELTFPEPAVLAERERVAPQAAEEIMDLARVHHATQQTYHSALRKWIDEHGRVNLDAPMLVGLDMSKHGAANVGSDLYRLWLDYHETQRELVSLVLEHNAHTGSPRKLEERVRQSLRDSRVVRVCPYKVDHAVDWVRSRPKKNPGCILWYKHHGIGEWLIERLRAAGVAPVHCPAGDEANALLETSRLHEIADRAIVASYPAHGVGKNLQLLNQQLFVQWPRSAKDAEQTLGRMHRNRQEAAEVWAHTCNTTEFDQQNFAATLNDALYVHQTTGSRQKLIYATYSPGLPKVFPSAVLRERGFQNKKLSPEQQALMDERFGGQA